MAENSEISWTDNTFNPWVGCTKLSPACANCYAEKDFDKRRHVAKWGDSGTRVVTSKANWRNPTRWNSKAREQGIRTRVFCASLSDVFEDWQGAIRTHDGGRMFVNPDGEWMTTEFVATRVPFGSRFATMDDLRSRLFRLIDATPHLDWLLLTKRPENIRRMWPDEKLRENVWLGTSVENQEYADRRIPELFNCRELSPVLFLSCEPLVGRIELQIYSKFCPTCKKEALPIGLRSDNTAPFNYFCRRPRCGDVQLPSIDWVITGGESGPNARPADPDWFRALRDQCDEAGVPFHFKQWGEFDANQVRVGKKNTGRMLDGEMHDAFPVVMSSVT